MAKNLVLKATSDDRDPPQGPVLKELETLSKGSITDAQLIEETLLVRLKKNNANIKWKSLKVIKHLAINGNPSIARNFQKNHEAIRDCVNFTGTQHPLYGDEMNERVRTAAKECITAVFQAPTQTVTTNYDLEQKMKGFGGGSDPNEKKSSYVNTYYTPSGGSGSMPGFGSTPAPAPADTPSVLDNMKSAVGGAFGSLANLSLGKKEEVKEPNMYDPPGSYQVPTGAFGGPAPTYGGSSFSGASGGFGSQPSFSQPAVNYPAAAPSNATANPAIGPRTTTKKEKRKKGEVPKSSVFGDDESPSNVSLPSIARDPAPVWSSAPTIQPAAPPAALNPAIFGGAGFSGAPNFTSPSRPAAPKGNQGRGTPEVEGQLVADLCTAVGVKTVPPKEKLDKICSVWASLDQYFVAEELDAKLADDEPWQVQKKALIVLEKLAEIDSDVLKEHFQESPENLESLATSSSTSTVQKKARELIDLLDLDLQIPEPVAAPVASYPTSATYSTPAAPAYSAPAANPAPSFVQSSGVVNLMEGMTISQPPAVVLSQPAFAPQPVAPVAVVDNSPSPFVSSVVQPKAPANDDLLDLFPTTAAPPAASKPPSGSEFLASLQSASRPAPELSFNQSSINLVDSSSQFGFLSSTAPAPVPQPAPSFGFAAPAAAFNPYAAVANPYAAAAPAYPQFANPVGFGAQPVFAAQPAFGGNPYGAGMFGGAAAAPAFTVQAAQPDLFSTAQPMANRSSNANRGTSRQSAPKKPDEFGFVQDMMSGH
eukprot:TRINITY_DN6274_c0_g1_i1.p1 TRINITY_DN6274_c0_g1~~TRINITY_DN6274_c0_g1_i1.p1  ORF type:complete len:764 (+),score=226.13 TRINITY_DN6274_c0_g1_i1:65-2356(+)